MVVSSLDGRETVFLIFILIVRMITSVNDVMMRMNIPNSDTIPCNYSSAT